ncbi:hypothetical protein NE664_00055 [Anaerotignum faecicola]|nr:hypothetical protein [Anaerotignum faecicola]
MDFGKTELLGNSAPKTTGITFGTEHYFDDINKKFNLKKIMKDVSPYDYYGMILKKEKDMKSVIDQA